MCIRTYMPSRQELARPNNSAGQKPFPLQWPTLDLGASASTNFVNLELETGLKLNA